MAFDLTVPSRSTNVLEKDTKGNDLPVLDKRYYYLLLAIVQRLGGVSGGVSITTGLIDSTVATDGKILRGSTSSGRYEQSNFTVPSSIVANNLVYGSSTNVVGQISTANSSTLITSNTGVPSWANEATFKAHVNLEIGTDVQAYDVKLTTVATGGGIQLGTGANARMGTAALTTGNVTISNTSVTANTTILLTNQNGGSAPGALYVSARNPGSNFTVTSTNGADDCTVAFILIEPF